MQKHCRKRSWHFSPLIQKPGEAQWNGDYIYTHTHTHTHTHTVTDTAHTYTYTV